ncbi:serine/threonine-protein phosphatase 6 regulatory subunit 3 isoform X2 [Belonocnema kinseyi]|uniref:serine/threonine-protein phosphatase 6 regulatory subunit 3 isoform X2 n=1 Tax=Belonocnema kinseyi TaxID=2817044 RepID=UPI00143DA5E6|nr:serine/threonine-protein phosphatase 6 regulatory subunit 3 isoform X2 [Belonocnema kinseyi]
MFWTTTYVSSPQVEALLSKQDFSLYELMDIDDIIQECKSQNKKLIEFITRPEVMQELVTLTTKEPPIDLEERRRYKYPNVACELLTCDLPSVNEKLAGDEVLLSKLYSFIDTDEPLNPLLASFFSRTIGVLVARVSDQNWYSYQFTCLQVLEFLKSRQRCVELLLHHLETSAIMDLILKLVTQVEGSDMRYNILNWLDSQQLVQRLIKLLSPEAGSSKHGNSCQLLCDMITEGREYKINLTERPEADPILQRLESIETVTLILETILSGEKVESSIVGGIQVLLTLLTQKNKCVSSDADRGSGSSDELINNEQCLKISNATIPFLEQLNKLLLEPPQKPSVSTTVGVLDVPFGNTRLHVVKLLVTLLSTENATINEKLVDLDTFHILLDLFFKYSWNNFLHTQVQQFFQLAIEWNCPDTNELIYKNIFVKCKLIERILEGWEENDNRKKEKSGVRQAYMGHLIDIANNLVTQCEKNNVFNNFLKANVPAETLTNWENFVSTELEDINKTQRIMLGGPAQVYMIDSGENSDVYHYSQEVYAQQVYSNYQGQQLGSQFASYSAHDEKFIDGDEALHNTVGQLGTIDFILNDDDLTKGEDLFSKVCFQKRKSLGEDNGEINWGDGSEISFQTVIDKEDGFCSKKSQDSSSSEEEEEDPCDMEIDSNEDKFGSNIVLPAVNPWDIATVEPVEQTGWANFDNFESTLNIDSKADPEPFKASFSDVLKAPAPVIGEQLSLNLSTITSLNSNVPDGSGDKTTIKSAESSLAPSVETICTEQANITCLGPVNPDSNANPITINRTPTAKESSKDGKEIVQNSLETVKPLTDPRTANVVENESVAEDLIL